MNTLRYKHWFEKSLRMVWEVEKDGIASYLVGTAHFFPSSYEGRLLKLLDRVTAAAFEGPLDNASMQIIAEHGRNGNGRVQWNELVTPQSIRQIDRILAQRLDPNGDAQLFTLFQPSQPTFFEQFTHQMRPWMVMFSIWTVYLDWQYSVDMQGYQAAKNLGKQIYFLETLDEQLEVLDGIPLERIQSHLNSVEGWGAYKKNFERYFQSGDLDNLLAVTNYFPTRCPSVVSVRDHVLAERMLTLFEKAPTAAFVGVPHIPGVSQLLVQAGYTLTQGSV